MTFYTYLSENDLFHMFDDASPDELSALRKEYREQYQKAYQKEYAKKRIHKTVVFTNEEFSLLQKASENHNLPFSSFVRQSSLNYLSNGYIVPDKEQTKAVLVALKKYGTNLNQIAHQCNSQKFASNVNISDAQENFNRLEQQIEQVYTQPIQITDLIRDAFNKQPEYITEIQNVINEFQEQELNSFLS